MVSVNLYYHTALITLAVGWLAFVVIKSIIEILPL